MTGTLAKVAPRPAERARVAPAVGSTQGDNARSQAARRTRCTGLPNHKLEPTAAAWMVGAASLPRPPATWLSPPRLNLDTLDRASNKTTGDNRSEELDAMWQYDGNAFASLGEVGSSPDTRSGNGEW